MSRCFPASHPYIVFWAVSAHWSADRCSHADPRTTMRYDRARTSLDGHATYIVATYIAGAAR